ncbi:MAG TPA: 2-C-methyl-D-erythritol 4-phosphate cytidylyltransferase [Solirubrobacteraceae bacterium]|nr:2-C-methyl-D-erythritol 4-phosphate cytidylyltransferase [Solirubrobacteraceae bacterium]
MAVALIVAAGSGERLGADRPKALVDVAGRAMYRWSLQALADTRGIERIAIAAPHDFGESADEPAFAVTREVIVVPGGATRSESVHRALAAVGPGDPVLVHDAARPLLTPRIARHVLDALAHDPGADAAIAAVPVTDTIKRVDEHGTVRETLDRRALWAVQTPQVFRRAALERALDVPAEELAKATDDAWLVERAGGKVIVVRSSEENIKVTTPLDLCVAEMLLRERAGGSGAQHAL